MLYIPLHLTLSMYLSYFHAEFQQQKLICCGFVVSWVCRVQQLVLLASREQR